CRKTKIFLLNNIRYLTPLRNSENNHHFSLGDRVKKNVLFLIVFRNPLTNLLSSQSIFGPGIIYFFTVKFAIKIQNTVIKEPLAFSPVYNIKHGSAFVVDYCKDSVATFNSPL